MKKWFTLILVALISINVSSQSENNDSIEVSLLTCNPGTEIYSLFGHTAIRYQDFDNGQDIVYNYGMFSFKTPNFVYRFVKGETDYELGIIPYKYFESEYATRGSSVYQQTLNLTNEEKVKLKSLLDENYLPYNRVYRYNYFYDNCTSRARDKIEESINGKIKYTDNGRDNSFRSIIHQFTKDSDWDEMGIDFCLGAEADRTISKREEMFSPLYLLNAMKGATIVDGDSLRPLIKEEGYIVNVEPVIAEKGFVFSPFVCACLFLLMNLIVFYYEFKKNRILLWWNAVMFAMQGIAGCIIAFLFFFSVHPTVGTNWLLVPFNPIPLFYLPFMIYYGIKRRKDIYHYINAAILTLFILLMPFIGQKFNLSILPLTASLLVCSLAYIIYYRKNNR